MKFTIAAFALLSFTGLAHADMIKRANLNLTCTFAGTASVIKITSSESGSIVTVNGAKVLESEQLNGGTEGGAPYLQAVGGGYNITISGGDFQKAFYASSSIVGEAPASLWAEHSNGQGRGVCKGTFSF